MGYYDLIIGMDWLEVHSILLDYIRKLLHFLDDEGKEKVLRGTNIVVSLQFVSLSLKRMVMFSSLRDYSSNKKT